MVVVGGTSVSRDGEPARFEQSRRIGDQLGAPEAEQAESGAIARREETRRRLQPRIPRLQAIEFDRGAIGVDAVQDADDAERRIAKRVLRRDRPTAAAIENLTPPATSPRAASWSA